MRYPKFESPSSVLLLIAVFALLVPLGAFAQEAEEPSPDEPFRTVIKQTRYIEVDELQSILQMLGLQIRLKPDANAIVLRGQPAKIETALELIEHLDVPPRPGKSVEVSAFVISASKEDGGSTDVPEELESTVDQLRQLFGYESFTLLDTVFLRVRDGRPGRLEGGISFDTSGSTQTAYQLTFQKAEVIPQEEGGRVIRLDQLAFELNGAHGGQIQRAAFRTDVEVREGQKAVVGKSTPRGTGGTLVLIVEAKVKE